MHEGGRPEDYQVEECRCPEDSYIVGSREADREGIDLAQIEVMFLDRQISTPRWVGR